MTLTEQIRILFVKTMKVESNPALETLDLSRVEIIGGALVLDSNGLTEVNIENVQSVGFVTVVNSPTLDTICAAECFPPAERRSAHGVLEPAQLSQRTPPKAAREESVTARGEHAQVTHHAVANDVFWHNR